MTFSLKYDIIIIESEGKKRKGIDVMIISVQFKDRNKVFKGKVYDYKLHPEEEIPRRGSIIRMMDEDYNYRCYGTRVKVVDVQKSFEERDLDVIHYIETTLED